MLHMFSFTPYVQLSHTSNLYIYFTQQSEQTEIFLKKYILFIYLFLINAIPVLYSSHLMKNSRCLNLRSIFAFGLICFVFLMMLCLLACLFPFVDNLQADVTQDSVGPAVTAHPRPRGLASTFPLCGPCLISLCCVGFLLQTEVMHPE